MMTDRIADMLARIRNAQMAMLSYTDVPCSSILVEMLKVLVEEGYVRDFEVSGDIKKVIRVYLKYYNGKPVISQMKRCSKPGKREYSGIKILKKFYNGLGVYILSTPKGVMTDHKARQLKVGGEILCCVF